MNKYKVIVKTYRGRLAKLTQEDLHRFLRNKLTQEDLESLSRKIYESYLRRFVVLTKEELNSLMSKTCKPTTINS